MNTRKFFLSLLLLVTATFMSGVFAQSAEEAAKYGQLQEIQVPKAGKLGKFIKKADPNATALKISGEINEKDLAILFSLPNIAYLDMKDSRLVVGRYDYKEGKEKKWVILGTGDFLLMYSNTLKFLALPSKTMELIIPDNYSYSLDMLVVDGRYNITGTETSPNRFFTNCPDCSPKRYTPSNITFKCAKIRSDNYLRGHYGEGEDALTKKHNKNRVGYIIGNEDREGYTDYYRNNISREQRDKVHTLFIPNENVLQFSVVERFDPEEIFIESTGKKILNRYVGGSNADVSGYDEIREYAFANSSVVTVTLGNNIKKLPRGCFYNCKSLTSINMPSVEEFGEYALEGATSLALSEYVLSANIQEIDVTSLPSSVKVINLTQHKYPPILNNYEPKKEVWKSGVIFTTDHTFIDLGALKDIEFIVPKGSFKKYQIGNWKYLHITEEGAQDTYSFQLDSVGSLKNLLTEDIIPNVKKLTLKGVLGETDFEYIRKCKNLQYLDMASCFTFEETQAAKERYSERAGFWRMVAGGVEASQKMNQQKYDNREISTEEAAKRETAAQIAKSFLPETMSPEEMNQAFGKDRVIWRQECYFPEFAFEGLCWLEHIKFPQKLVAIHKDLFASIAEMQHLKTIHFSEETVLLGDHIFSGASNLKNINIPRELMIIGRGCFKGCAIDKVDLTNTKIKYWVLTTKEIMGVQSYGLTLDAFFDCPLTEFYSPKNIKVPEGCERLRDSSIEERYGEYTSPVDKRLKTTNTNPVKLYFYFEEPFCSAQHFENIYGKAKEIHIPRGMKAAWPGYSNLIDDIDL